MTTTIPSSPAPFSWHPTPFSWRPNDDADTISASMSGANSKSAGTALEARLEHKRATFEGQSGPSIASLSPRVTPEADQASLGWAERTGSESLKSKSTPVHGIADTSAEHHAVNKQLTKISKTWRTYLWKRRRRRRHVKQFTSPESDETPFSSPESNETKVSKSGEGSKGTSPKYTSPKHQPPANWSAPRSSYAMLIGDAILQRPKKRRSAIGICKDIMKQHEWYDKNRHTGWQAAISNELARNSSFEPISVRRLGRATDAIKWQISSSKYRSMLMEFQDTGSDQFQGTGGDQIHDIEVPFPTITSLNRDPIELPMPEPQEMSAIVLQSNSSKPTFTPIVRRERWPYTFGFNNISNSLYKTQLLVSDGDVDSSVALGYSALGRTATSKGKERALQAVESHAFPNSNSIITGSLNGNRSHAQSQDEGRGNASSQDQDNSTAAPSENTGSHDQDKINLDEDRGNDSHEDDEDDGGNRKRKRFRSPIRGGDKSRFPCPYHVHDPLTYGVNDRRYLTCAAARFKFISELVRHLGRTHDEHACSKCMQFFETKAFRDQHSSTCSQRLRQSQEELWSCICRTLFPFQTIANTVLQDNRDQSFLQTPSAESEISSAPSNDSRPKLSANHSSQPEIAPDLSTVESVVGAKTENLRIDIQSLKTRVGVLEQRLSPIEQTTTLFQSMLATNDKTTGEIGKRGNALAASSRYSGDSHSEISTSPESSDDLSGRTEVAGFEEQLCMMLMTGKLRITLSHPTNRANSDLSSLEKGKQRFDITNDGPINVLYDEITSDGSTLCGPSSGDFPNLPGAATKNPLAETNLWTKENSDDTVLEDDILPSYHVGNHQSCFCCVHGNACKSPDCCQRFELSSVFKEQPGNTSTRDDVPMGNDGSMLQGDESWKDMSWDEWTSTNG